MAYMVVQAFCQLFLNFYSGIGINFAVLFIKVVINTLFLLWYTIKYNRKTSVSSDKCI